jgi:hypothetical protein
VVIAAFWDVLKKLWNFSFPKSGTINHKEVKSGVLEYCNVSSMPTYLKDKEYVDF